MEMFLVLLSLFISLTTASCEWDCAQCIQQHCTAYYPCDDVTLFCPPLVNPVDHCQQLQCQAGICRIYTTTNCTLAPTPAPMVAPIEPSFLGMVVVMLMGLMLVVAICIGGFLTR